MVEMFLCMSFHTFLCRLDNELKDMKEKYAVPARWLPNDTCYEECEHTLLFSKSEQLLLQASQRRAFLVDLKRKYAGIISICDDNT